MTETVQPFFPRLTSGTPHRWASGLFGCWRWTCSKLHANDNAFGTWRTGTYWKTELEKWCSTHTHPSRIAKGYRDNICHSKNLLSILPVEVLSHIPLYCVTTNSKRCVHLQDVQCKWPDRIFESPLQLHYQCKGQDVPGWRCTCCFCFLFSPSLDLSHSYVCTFTLSGLRFVSDFLPR